MQGSSRRGRPVRARGCMNDIIKDWTELSTDNHRPTAGNQQQYVIGCTLSVVPPKYTTVYTALRYNFKEVKCIPKFLKVKAPSPSSARCVTEENERQANNVHRSILCFRLSPVK